MNELLKDLPEKIRKKIRKKEQPLWENPMLATLTHDYFSDKDWIFERKLDGERCLIFKNGKDVRLMSRNKKKLNNTYPEIVEALEAQKAEKFIADGEIVAFDGNVTSFSKLQQRMQLKDPAAIKKTKVKVFYYIFDLLYLDEHDLTQLPLTERKKILKNLLDFEDPLRFTIHRNEKGEKFHEEACKKGWEGIIAKKADSSYAHSRSSNWLKFKCVNRQEFVIGGYTDPQGSRIGFGSLLIGFYKGKELQYAGKVGTGYNDEFLKDLHKRMQKIETDEPPFAKDKALPSKNVHWIKPKLVGEIGFTEWTSSNKLRHPRFVGLRRDKKAAEVVKE